MKTKDKKVVVGLSGGVDSSVSLLLLKKAGYQPIGVSFKYAVWKDKRNKLKENVCCSEKSFVIAGEICQRLDVPYRIIDQEINFKDRVIGYFLDILKQKGTPNPCLICNRFVKFEQLIRAADQEKAAYAATGHYAKIENNRLLMAKDKTKDQSYFLALLTQEQLKRIIFPLGNYTKKQVYRVAKKEGFDFFDKTKQSQDLCFVASQSVSFFLEEKLGFEPGEIVDSQGNVLGKHHGLYFYTIGQRKGIGLSGGPWWVVGTDKKKNQLIVTNRENDPLLFRKEIVLSDYNFISGKAPKKPLKVMAKTRYNQKLSSATLYPPKDNALKIVFNRGRKAITPGQWTVFYLKDICLGGGVIKL